MNNTLAEQLLQEAQVLQQGHFLLTSGRHSDRYMQCAYLFQQPQWAGKLCQLLCDQWQDAGIDTVVGPAVGAVQMAYEVSRQLGCRNLFAERVDGILTLRRGFSLQPGEKVLVVEDTVTTGGTVREVIALCNSIGAVVVGVGSIVDRSGGAVDFGVPFKSAFRAHVESWLAEDCPLCKQNLAFDKPGSRIVNR